jgi:hypothetical protein
MESMDYRMDDRQSLGLGLSTREQGLPLESKGEAKTEGNGGFPRSVSKEI